MKRSEKTPNFSVVIPCYNLGEYVDDAIASIESQTLSDVEIIIVDDASPNEDTKAILKRLEGKVKVIYREKNGGASAARNTGVSAARAPYILCLDSDDTVAPDYLKDAFELLESRPDVGVAAPYTKMTGEREGVWKPKAEKATFPQALISSPIPNASCFRKTAWESAGGYDENLRGMEDWEFWISILEKDWVIEVIPKPHYIYLNRPGSKVKTSNKNAHSIVSHIVTRHHSTFAKHMDYVIAGTHKKYVDERTRARQLDSGLVGSDLLNHNLFKLPKKLKTVAKLLFIERDIPEIKRRVNNKLGR